VHGAPLSVDDVEDCYLILLSALGVPVGELHGDLAAGGGRKVLDAHMKRLMRQQSRRILKGVIGKIAGKEVAKTAAKRTVLRVFAPLVSIPLSIGLSFAATRGVLNQANAAMRRRAAVVKPLVRLFHHAPSCPREPVLRAFVAVADTPGVEWTTAQLDALRHSKSALSVLEEDHLHAERGDRPPLDEVVAALPSEIAGRVGARAPDEAAIAAVRVSLA
jgi:hypothetical protein